MTSAQISLTSAVVSPIVTAAITGLFTYVRSHRARLVWNVTPTTYFTIETSDNPKQHVETGVLRLENRSSEPLHNVIVAHRYTQVNYVMSEPIQMTEVRLEGNCVGFSFATFPARSTLTISYLFLEKPTGNILGRIYSDEGEGVYVQFAFQKQLPTWQIYSTRALAFCGGWAILYGLIKAGLVVYTLAK